MKEEQSRPQTVYRHCKEKEEWAGNPLQARNSHQQDVTTKQRRFRSNVLTSDVYTVPNQWCLGPALSLGRAVVHISSQLQVQWPCRRGLKLVLVSVNSMESSKCCKPVFAFCFSFRGRVIGRLSGYHWSLPYPCYWLGSLFSLSLSLFLHNTRVN